MLRPAFILAVAAVFATPVAAQTRLTLGQTVIGELTSSDQTLNDQTHFDCFSVETVPDRRVQVDMTSDDFDSYLMAGGGACTQMTDAVQDDDGGGGLNARIVHMGTGRPLYIFANSVGAGATGSYRLRAWSSTGGTPTVTRLNVGQTVNGTLSTSDMTLPDSSHYDCFSVNTRAGQQLQIDMTSNDFDSYLSVGSGACEELAASARDDDGGGGLNARIVHDGDGAVLFIQANSASAGETGAYQLRIAPAQGQSPAPAPARQEPYANLDTSRLAASRPTSLPAVTSEWGTDAMTCFAVYGVMVAMTAENVAPREWGNVGQIDYAARQARLRSRVDFNSPEAVMIEFNTANFKSMALVGAIGLAPNGQPNQGRPLAEYLTALANCDRAHNLVPVTRY